MCGIFGVVDKDVHRFDTDQLRKFYTVQRHRGPDDNGEYLDNHAFLGFNRLSIIDLSENGHQPMTDRSQRYWIIFNGEIYNFQELRKLIEPQHTLRSRTDTEVVLYLYMEYGAEMLPHLDGMFAMAIWDSKEKTLFLARDRFGEKPIWYVEREQGISFSSEIRTLLRTGMVSTSLDTLGLYMYPWLGTSVYGKSVIKDIEGIKPGHYIHYVMDSKPKQVPYWKLQTIPSFRTTRKEAVEQVRHLLNESIEKRLISDVPLGLFYSGGIDSSVIAALVRKFQHEELHSFSIGFEENDYDESDMAALGAAYYGLQHHAFKLSAMEVLDHIPRFIQAMDFPIVDGFNSYFVSMFAREKFTVALSGIGGDELFGGYSTFRFMHLLKKLKFASVPLKKLSGRVFKSLTPSMQANWKMRVLAFAGGAFQTEGLQHELARTFYRSSELETIFSDEFLDHSYRHSPLDKLNDLVPDLGSDHIGRITLREIQSYMSYLLLPAIDVFSMHSSLEVRSPFLSHRLFEFVYSLPAAVKFDPDNQKSLLVDAFREFLPSQLIHRKKKGFGFPFEKWVFLPEYKSLICDTLESTKFKNRNIFSQTHVNNFLSFVYSRHHDKLPHQVFMKLWAITVLELWLQENLDG
ncbi:asparagine synthase (glutamine-hydrolyzing) [bacterium]|nr:asparagine synthase (glutamine-hydrolyzing) [bacterium]